MSRHSIFAPNDSERLYNHMAMLARLPNGTLVSAWQTSAVGEGESDMHIRLSLSLDPRGHSWAPSVEAPTAATQLGPRWSPVLHVDSTSRLWLFYSQSISSVCHAPGGDIWVVTYAEDEGWDTPRLLLGASHQGLINKVRCGPSQTRAATAVHPSPLFRLHHYSMRCALKEDVWRSRLAVGGNPNPRFPRVHLRVEGGDGVGVDGHGDRCWRTR